MNHFWTGFEKQAVSWTSAADLAGLGALAAPTVQSMRGKPMTEQKRNKYELAGLGILAAPSAINVGQKALQLGKKVFTR